MTVKIEYFCDIHTLEMLTNVYVLRLEGDNYYVGRSKNPHGRIAMHFAKSGAAWTKLHYPVAVESITYNVDYSEENKLTKAMMRKHGVEKVRGGSHTRVVLSPAYIKSLQLWAVTDSCTKCGSYGHSITSCRVRVNNLSMESKNTTWTCSYCKIVLSDPVACGEHNRTCVAHVIKVVPPSWRCGVCNAATFGAYSDYVAHRSTCGQTPLGVTCMRCGAQFARQAELNQHEDAAHTLMGRMPTGLMKVLGAVAVATVAVISAVVVAAAVGDSSTDPESDDDVY